MERCKLNTLRHWFRQAEHKPIVLRGARQTGKSTLVRIFCEQQEIELVELNFERNPEHATLFESNDPYAIVNTLRLLLNKSVQPGRSLLFLDEIQAAPQLLASLRYFYEEMPHLHLIAAGSLLDFELASPSYAMPVGRISYLYLHPMSFREFLMAMGESALADYLAGWSPETAIPEPLHHKLMLKLRECMAVGGMPEAVRSFSRERDFRATEQIKQDLLATFSDDFAKYAPQQDQGLLRQVFRKAPAMLGRKIKYSEINADRTAAQVARAIDKLAMARVIHQVIRTAGNGLPLAAEENEKFFKMLFLDTGLISTMLNLGSRPLQEDLLLINQGALAEQWVGQELLSSTAEHQQPRLHYWAREAKSSAAEIDYLIAGKSAVPVEVKAGKSGSLKSLHQFIREKKAPLAVRFNADLPSLMYSAHAIPDGSSVEYRLLSLPLYLAGEARRIVADLEEASTKPPLE